jgi:hypothetical protein
MTVTRSLIVATSPKFISASSIEKAIDTLLGRDTALDKHLKPRLDHKSKRWSAKDREKLPRIGARADGTQFKLQDGALQSNLLQLPPNHRYIRGDGQQSLVYRARSSFHPRPADNASGPGLVLPLLEVKSHVACCSWRLYVKANLFH